MPVFVDLALRDQTTNDPQEPLPEGRHTYRLLLLAPLVIAQTDGSKCLGASRMAFQALNDELANGADLLGGTQPRYSCWWSIHNRTRGLDVPKAKWATQIMSRPYAELHAQFWYLEVFVC
jgi:hypothetical protein